MGDDRDGEVKAVSCAPSRRALIGWQPKHKYYDPEVCQCFLEGICLHKVFNNTKLDAGPCPKVHQIAGVGTDTAVCQVHDNKLRSEYLKMKEKGRDNFEVVSLLFLCADLRLFQNAVQNELQRSIEECDRKIQRAIKRLEDEGL